MNPHETDASDFDKEFFDRFYLSSDTRASGPDEFRLLSGFVLSYLEYLEVELLDVLDLGCGLGRWKQALTTYDDDIVYTGVDVSQYACEKYGWQHGSVEEFRSEQKYDLVIWQDVLPYLRKNRLEAAIENIARHCRGAAYLQVITLEDWENDICDPHRTDLAMNRFDAAWYRTILGRYFVNCGGGVFIPRKSDVVLWELEHC